MRRARREMKSPFGHIIVQGIQKQYIFEKKEYKEKYFKLINENLNRYNIKLIAYVIMDNHVHMCLYYEKIENLSNFMHTINSKFANYYNYMENRVGYLFRNRFYCQEIKDRQQLFNVIAYIHNNPLKAKIIKSLEDHYNYSSYKDYIENNIDTEIIYLVFETIEYHNVFDYIHKNYDGYDVDDIKEENRKSYIEVIDEYVKANRVSLDIIVKEPNLLFELVKKLKIETSITNKKIAEVLKINKNKVTKINKTIQNLCGS